MQINLGLNQSPSKMSRPPETAGHNERPRGRGRGGLGMVGLSMDAFIVAQVDVLLAGHFSVQLPTHVGDVNSQNHNKSR